MTGTSSGEPPGFRAKTSLGLGKSDSAGAGGGVGDGVGGPFDVSFSGNTCCALVQGDSVKCSEELPSKHSPS